jgi:hypothetical protein
MFDVTIVRRKAMSRTIGRKLLKKKKRIPN